MFWNIPSNGTFKGAGPGPSPCPRDFWCRKGEGFFLQTTPCFVGRRRWASLRVACKAPDCRGVRNCKAVTELSKPEKVKADLVIGLWCWKHPNSPEGRPASEAAVAARQDWEWASPVPGCLPAARCAGPRSPGPLAPPCLSSHVRLILLCW